MKEKEKLELVRNLLHNGMDMDFNEELILKISQKLDKYIVEYLQRNSRIEVEKEIVENEQ